MWEKRRIFTPLPPPPMQGCSSLVSQYHNTGVLTFLKLMIMTEHIKLMQIPYLDMCSVLLSGQLPNTRNSSHLHWNLKDPVLLETLSYRIKITYHLLMIGFYHKLILMQDIGHNICYIYM